MIRINKFFIFFILLSLASALTFGGLLPFLILYTLISIIIVSYAYILIVKSSLSVKVVINEGYYCAGDTLEYTAQVNCSALCPIPYVEVRSKAYPLSSDYVGELITLTSNENAWITSKINFYCRGIYDLGSISIKIYDLFNIVNFTKQEDKNIKIKVYPKIFDIAKISGGGKDIFISTINKNVSNEDQFTIKDVRKYRSGDSLKKVHWRLSAKHNELYVKNSDTISGEEISIFLDMHRNNYEYSQNGVVEEALVDVSMSIINYMRKMDISTNLFANSSTFTNYNIDCKDDFNSLMELMINIKSDGTVPIEDFIQNQYYRLHKANKIVVVTAKLSTTFTSSITALKTRGYYISVFYCIDDIESLQNSSVLVNSGVACLNIKNLIVN